MFFCYVESLLCLLQGRESVDRIEIQKILARSQGWEK